MRLEEAVTRSGVDDRSARAMESPSGADVLSAGYAGLNCCKRNRMLLLCSSVRMGFLRQAPSFPMRCDQHLLIKLWIADVLFGILGSLCVIALLDNSVDLQLHDMAAMPTFRLSSYIK